MYRSQSTYIFNNESWKLVYKPLHIDKKLTKSCKSYKKCEYCRKKLREARKKKTFGNKGYYTGVDVKGGQVDYLHEAETL